MASRSRREQLQRVRDTGAASRDPCAAPVTMQNNVSIPATCEFYGVQDAISTCRVPRSCRDCLAMPGCVLSPMGCVSESSTRWSVSASDDYHNLTTTYPHGSAFNKTVLQLLAAHSKSVFFSANATYCAASDPICTQCRTTFQAAAQVRDTDTYVYLGTHFCVGDGGCVCVAQCEVPAYRASQVFDTECGMDRPIYRNPAPIKTKLQPFSSTKRDPRAAPSQLTHRTTAETWSITLNKMCVAALSRGCMISGLRCKSMETYESATDFRRANMSSSILSAFAYSFPSANTSYCPLSDPICTKCRTRFLQNDLNYKIAYDTSFCVGVDGCVGIEFCESQAWATRAIDQGACRQRLPDAVSKLPTYLVSFSLAAVVWITLFMTYKIIKYEGNQFRQGVVDTSAAILRHMLDQVPALTRLDLFGWRQYQQRLHLKEMQLLTGVDHELVSPVRHPIDFDWAHPSAPDFDDDESSAPTAQDPRALASAPGFRQDPDEHEKLKHDDGDDARVATAPDFEGRS